METEHFAQFLARQGYRVLQTESLFWYEVHPFCWQGIPYHGEASPSPRETNRLFFKNFAFLIRYFSESRHDILPGSIWVCDSRDYDLSSLAIKSRNQVRRGLENNEIQQVGFPFLGKAGWNLILDTARRQARNPDFANQREWARYCAAAAGLQDLEAWGAFFHGGLASFLVGAKVEGYYYILHQASMTAELKNYPNNALIFFVTKLKLRDPEIQAVSYGLDSVEDTPGLKKFKHGMGFYQRPLHQKILINPLFRWIKRKEVISLVSLLLRAYPRNNYLRKAMALLSKGSEY
jgi:hypothetical protein